MGIEYYAFALFLAALICLIAILFKLLFANVRRQHKLLDEKEAKLLQLYRTVESIMDEFNDQIRTSIDEIKEYENRAVAHMAESIAQPRETYITEEPPAPLQPVKSSAKPMTVDSTRIRAASEVLERAERMVKSSGKKTVSSAAKAADGEVIQRLFDEPSGEPGEESVDGQPTGGRWASILALADEGKTRAEIAKELGITQNEVKLVIDLNGAARK